MLVLNLYFNRIYISHGCFPIVLLAVVGPKLQLVYFVKHVGLLLKTMKIYILQPKYERSCIIGPIGILEMGPFPKKNLFAFGIIILVIQSLKMT